MKAFLLAAGHGTRLRPLTNTVPKCLVPIRGTPMLRIWLDLCRRHGIDEVLINLHAHASAVRNFLAQNAGDITLHVSEERELLGSAGTLAVNRDWIGSDPLFWVFYGDVLTNVNLTDMLALHRDRRQLATIGVYRVPDPTRCGIVACDQSGIVRRFTEKPAVPESNLAFAGLLVGSPAIMDVIPPRVPADIGFDVLPKLVGRMAAYNISDYLIDVGTLATYNSAQETWPGFVSANTGGPC